MAKQKVEINTAEPPSTAKIIIFIAVVVLVAVGVLVFRIFRFRTRPEYQWLKKIQEKATELSAEKEKLQQAIAATGRQSQRIAELFEQAKANVPIDGLQVYPGIGPVTIERLKNAGVKTLAQADGYPFDDIHGIGSVGTMNIESAVANVVEETVQAFFAGKSAEGQQYRAGLVFTDANLLQEAIQQDAKYIATVEASKQCEALLKAGSGISFFNSLTGKAFPGVSPELLSRSAPIVRIPNINTPSVIPPVAPQKNSPVPPSSTPTVTVSDPQIEVLRILARFGFMVAKIEGRIAKDERKEIRNFLADTFTSPLLTRHIDPAMEDAEKNIPTVDDAIEELKSGVGVMEMLAVYRFAERIADASGDRNMKEVELLAKLKNALELAAAEETTALPEPAPAPTPARAETPKPPVAVKSNAREVLEIEAKTELSVELIRRKYNMAMARLDPAKAEMLGPEFAKLVAVKRTVLQAAAEELLQPFGQPLLPPPPPPPPSDIRHNPDLDAVFGV